MTSLISPDDLGAEEVASLAPPELTLQTLGWAILVLVVAFVVNKASNRAVERYVEHSNGTEHASATAKKLTAYITYSLAAIIVLGIFGVPLEALGAAVGLIGLGLSFALREMIANFISGLMILINRPFKIGDQINAEGETGIVEDIRVRATDIKTFDGRKVIVPNSKLYNETVINNTGYKNRRFDVMVGISYDDDIQKAKDLAYQTLVDAESVEEQPEPQVLTDELGGSSVDLRLRGWTHTGRASVVKASSEVTQLVKEKFDEEGIDIPYPIRTVYMEDE